MKIDNILLEKGLTYDKLELEKVSNSSSSGNLEGLTTPATILIIDAYDEYYEIFKLYKIQSAKHAFQMLKNINIILSDSGSS